MIEKICLECGKTFQVKKSRESTAKYCSRSCLTKAGWRKTPNRMFMRRGMNLSAQTKRKIGKSLKKFYQSIDGKALRKRKQKIMSETSKKWWSNPEHRKNISIKMREAKERIRGGFKEHQKAIDKTVSELTKQGFRCVPLDKKPRPDIIALKDNKIFAVEVEFGKADYTKYVDSHFYDDIIWLIKKR